MKTTNMKPEWIAAATIDRAALYAGTGSRANLARPHLTAARLAFAAGDWITAGHRAADAVETALGAEHDKTVDARRDAAALTA